MDASELKAILDAVKNQTPDEKSISFNQKSVTTTLIGVILVACVSGAIGVWVNDKDQDNKLDNFGAAINQIQANQVLLGEKFDQFADEPRYTKKQHDIEIEATLNNFDDIKERVKNNELQILELKNSQQSIKTKIQIIELKAVK